VGGFGGEEKVPGSAAQSFSKKGFSLRSCKRSGLVTEVSAARRIEIMSGGEKKSDFGQG